MIVKYIEGEQYEEGQKLLDTIVDDDTVDLSCEKKLLQAQVFEKTKRAESAYEIYEDMILKSANEIMFAVSFIIKQLCDEKKYDMAEKYIEILQKTCNLYDLDKISLFQSEMIISLHKKDKEKSIENLEKVIRKIREFTGDDKSELYKFKKYKNSLFNPKKYINLFKTMIDKNSDYEFIRDDIRVKEMFKKY